MERRVVSDAASIPSVVLVDDNALAAAAMERRFADSGELRWLGWTPDASQVVALVTERRPSIVLLDVDMPSVDSFQLLRMLVKECPGTGVIMFSGHDGPTLIERALVDGAVGYVHKDEPTATIVELIHRAARGECVLSPLASKTYMQAGGASEGA